MRIPVILAAASLVAASTRAPAQSIGTIELTGFASYTWFDDILRLDDKVGVGGSLGIYLLPRMAVELEGLYTKTYTPLNSEVSSFPPRVRLTYNIPLGGYASALQIGGGYVRNVYGNTFQLEDNGITGLAGIRVGLSENFALRLNGTIDYSPDPELATIDHYMNWGTQAGISILLGNKYDNDKDKVANKKDKCPNTTSAAKVDPQGCDATQRDTDTDGLADASDACPQTAAGQKPDSRGCSADQRDTDSDKIADSQDKCVSTPPGEAANETGCAESQLDADHDGVVNLADRCPSTDAGPAVDEKGCSPAQLDADGDKITDVADRCPATPAGEAVNADGCAVDTDGDGIADASDKCPGSVAGREIDETGCTRLFIGAERTLVLLGANFETGKAVLTEESKGAMKQVGQALAAHPDTKVEVAGHTDNTGSRATNTKLSKARAEAVMKFLVESGASPSQLTAKGYGPAEPLASNKTADGRAKNRRVELKRL